MSRQCLFPQLVLAIYVSHGRWRVMFVHWKKLKKNTLQVGRQLRPIITDNRRRRGRSLNFKTLLTISTCSYIDIHLCNTIYVFCKASHVIRPNIPNDGATKFIDQKLYGECVVTWMNYLKNDYNRRNFICTRDWVIILPIWYP